LAEERRTYVTLDNPMVTALAREEPALFLERYRPPLLIDEIQHAPELLPYLKMAVDSGCGRGAYWLTGSQPFHLMKGGAESLAGRVAVLHLLGLSRREVLGEAARGGPFLPDRRQLAEREAASPPLPLGELYQTITFPQQPHQAAGQGTQALLPGHRPVRLSNGMVESADVGSRGDVRRDLRNLGGWRGSQELVAPRSASTLVLLP